MSPSHSGADTKRIPRPPNPAFVPAREVRPSDPMQLAGLAVPFSVRVGRQDQVRGRQRRITVEAQVAPVCRRRRRAADRLRIRCGARAGGPGTHRRHWNGVSAVRRGAPGGHGHDSGKGGHARKQKGHPGSRVHAPPSLRLSPCRLMSLPGERRGVNPSAVSAPAADSFGPATRATLPSGRPVCSDGAASASPPGKPRSPPCR